MARSHAVRIDPMAPADWPAVHRIYAEGIATGDATLERDAPDWDHFDRSHRRDCRLVARAVRGGPAVGWVALTAYSARRVYSGVAWESVYVAADQRGRGVGRMLLEALIPASEAAGFWTLLAGIMVENEASLVLHERCGFERVGVMRSMGRDGTGRWRDVVLMQRRSQVIGT
ncbi:MAG TPA: GNAT family N-acetyltransferase [Candidatus Limnocylindrales bacterium]|nr:GNAT family N-acetyltransferase [Candidatus Limnocylindrales bacterium]